MPKKQKLPAEEIIAIVRQCLKGEMGRKEAGQQVGVGKTTILRWIRLYEAEGEGAFQLKERNRVYGPEVKTAAVTDYLAGKGSLREVCQKYNIRSECQLRDWIKVYNAHGDFNSVKQTRGGSYMKQGRHTTQEERIQIAQECIESGKNYGAIAQKYQVSYSQARTWTLRYEELGASGLEDRRGKRKKDQEPRTELERLQIENERLKHQLYLAEMERDLLKKLDEIGRRDAFRK